MADYGLDFYRIMVTTNPNDPKHRIKLATELSRAKPGSHDEVLSLLEPLRGRPDVDAFILRVESDRDGVLLTPLQVIALLDYGPKSFFSKRATFFGSLVLTREDGTRIETGAFEFNPDNLTIFGFASSHVAPPQEVVDRVHAVASLSGGLPLNPDLGSSRPAAYQCRARWCPAWVEGKGLHPLSEDCYLANSLRGVKCRGTSGDYTHGSTDGTANYGSWFVWVRIPNSTEWFGPVHSHCAPDMLGLDKTTAAEFASGFRRVEKDFKEIRSILRADGFEAWQNRADVENSLTRLELLAGAGVVIDNRDASDIAVVQALIDVKLPAPDQLARRVVSIRRMLDGRIAREQAEARRKAQEESNRRKLADAGLLAGLGEITNGAAATGVAPSLPCLIASCTGRLTAATSSYGPGYYMRCSRRGCQATDPKTGKRAVVPAALVPGSVACPLCASVTVQKSGKNGDFIGCSSFPACRFTAGVGTLVAAPPIPSGQGQVGTKFGAVGLRKLGGNEK